jgi:hypothetical protein
MEKIIFLFSILLFLSPKITIGQLALPQVTTTKEKALKDLANKITNENWYISKQDNTEYYQALFRNTPVGIKHAFDRLEKLKVNYGSKYCNDKSLFSSMAKDSNGEIEYEGLSISIKLESSEISIQCEVKDDKSILAYKLSSTDGGRDAFIVLMVLLR